MTTTGSVLAIVDDAALRADIDRVAAAAGSRVVHVCEPSSSAVWESAPLILVDRGGAQRCGQRDLPRRQGVLLVTGGQATVADWEAAVAVGAHRVMLLPQQEGDLVTAVAAMPANRRDPARRGPSVAVLGGAGGAGASVLSVALAQTAAESLLIDADPWSGGLDLVLGGESAPGLRWPDLTLASGRIGYDALRDALPAHRGVTVLSGGRLGADIAAGPLGAVIDAGRRGGVPVVCDVPRRATPASEAALRLADLVVVITPADLRSAAATAVTAGWARSINPNIGLVVRGPSPGGLRADDVARTVALPLLAAMRPQPGLAAAMERGGLRFGSRSPLAVATRRIVDLVRSG